MGQQQLLLLVIGIIVVAIAVLAGLYAFKTRFRQSIADNLVEHNLSIATEAVFWKTKRDPFWGGNAKYSGLANDGMQTLFLGDKTNVGTFKITKATDNDLEITAVATDYPDIGVRTYVHNYSIDSTAISYDGTITLEE